jgi:hypothetical protein
MNIETLIDKIKSFKTANGTKQSWRKDEPPTYENEYIKLVRIDSSNAHGGSKISQGKQWGFIVEQKKDFQSLKGWLLLKRELRDTLKVTPFRSAKFDWIGIRFYEMEKDPTNDIVIDILNFIFNQ